MEDIVYMSQNGRGSTFSVLLGSMQNAADQGRTFRVLTGRDKRGAWLKVKVGEGMWSAPLYGDPDPYGPAPELDEPETLGSCGCTDYHMSDCPTRTGYADSMSADEYEAERGNYPLGTDFN